MTINKESYELAEFEVYAEGVPFDADEFESLALGKCWPGVFARVARSPAGRAARSSAVIGVFRPPSKRISASAIVPTRKVKP